MLAGEALVAMPTWEKDVRRKHRAGLKYKKVEGDKWIIDTGKDRGSVRPIDLVSRDPDRLREFESKGICHGRCQVTRSAAVQQVQPTCLSS